jgi:uroporphyrinogen-III synthase
VYDAVPETCMRLNGLRVLTLESRRPDLVHNLIAEQGVYDMVIFTASAGTQYLLSVLAASGSVEPFLQALKKIQIVARGPKPVAALSELGVRVSVSVPESYTWREVLDATASLKCSNVAVQEYGVPNPELVDALRQRGLMVTPIAIYRWDLPEDLVPLEEAVRRICDRCHVPARGRSPGGRKDKQVRGYLSAARLQVRSRHGTLFDGSGICGKDIPRHG